MHSKIVILDVELGIKAPESGRVTGKQLGVEKAAIWVWRAHDASDKK